MAQGSGGVLLCTCMYLDVFPVVLGGGLSYGVVSCSCCCCCL